MPTKGPNCIGCPLQSHGSDFTDIEGDGSLGIMAVAESSGEMEARDGLPLRPFAPAGMVFERTLRRLGLSRDQFTVTNMLRCKPRQNLLSGMAYESSAIEHCRSNLELVYLRSDRPRPKVILALGNIPFSYLTGHGGPGMTVSNLRGYVFPISADYSQSMATDADLTGCVVIPTYHPSHIRRGATELFGVLARDVMRAVRIARGDDCSYILDDPLMAVYREELQYELHPSLDEAWSYYHRLRDQPNSPLSYDLETSESASLDEDARDQFSDTRIRQIQFTAERASGIAFPWQDGYRDVVAAIMKLPNVKVGWNNQYFDDRVLRAASEAAGQPGIYLPSGTTYDAMQMWKRWQPELPANLQYASSFVEFPTPWKHLASKNLPLYGIFDTDSCWRNFQMIHRSMSERGMWEPYLQQVVALHDLPSHVAANGLHVSAEIARDVTGDLTSQQTTIAAELDAIYPDSERTYSPKEGYKKTPRAIIDGGKLWQSERLGMLLGGEPTVRDGELEIDYLRRTTGMLERNFEAAIKNPATLMMEKHLVMRWCQPDPVSPNSRQQIIRYAKLKRHEVPTVKDGRGGVGEVRESLTLADIDLMYGRTRDRFYGLIGKWRRLAEEKRAITELQMESGVLRGHIHPVFSVVADCTGDEMAVKSPGLPAISSAAIRMIVPAAGRLFVKWSWPQQRDRILAGLAAIPESRVTFAAIATADPKLIHPSAMEGFLRGESDRAILDANRITFGTSLKTIMDMRRRFSDLWPEVTRWHNEVREKAHRNNYLLNRFGEIRWFYEVFAPDGKGGMRLGDQAVAASRFIAETEAAGAMRWRLNRIVAGGVLATWNMVAMSRDWMMFEVDEEKAIEHVRGLHAMLSVVAPQLPAVVLSLEVAVGSDWSNMQVLKLERRGGGGAG